MPSTIRFLRQYLRPRRGVTTAVETHYTRGRQQLPATVLRPVHSTDALPAWVMLHGLTHTGRSHPGLLRFAHALAAAGNVVLVPAIPEWQKLRVEPGITVDTIGQAVRALQQRDDVLHEHVGLLGFSFGASQALIACADDDTARLLAGIASWGGYHDLSRVFRFGLTGRYGIDGVEYQTQPDPFGCWIMAANYLPHVPGHADTAPVARALHELAEAAGAAGTHAWDPAYDADKRRLRAGLRPPHRELFDRIAPATTAAPDPEALRLELAEALAATALERDPLLDPRPFLRDVRVPVLVAHGRDDRLIPFTESVRLSRAVSEDVLDSLSITALFQHSGGTQSGLGPIGTTAAAARFVRLLRRLLRLV